MLAIDGGVGPETRVTGAPATGVTVPDTAVMVEPVLLLIVIVIVRLAPAYKQDDDAATLAVKLLIARLVDVATTDDTVPPRCALALKVMTPLAVATELQLKMMVPDAPAARDREPPATQVGVGPVPTHMRVGGLGLDTTGFWAALELFLTVMRT